MAKLFGELESLKGQVPSRGQDKGSNTSLRKVLAEALEHGRKKRSRFARASAGHGDDVGAREDEGHGLPLNGSGHFVAFAFDSLKHIGTQTQRLETPRLCLLLLLLLPLQLRFRTHHNASVSFPSHLLLFRV